MLLGVHVSVRVCVCVLVHSLFDIRRAACDMQLMLTPLNASGAGHVSA